MGHHHFYFNNVHFGDVSFVCISLDKILICAPMWVLKKTVNCVMQEKNYDTQNPRISNQDHHSKTKDKTFIKKKKNDRFVLFYPS